MSAAYDVDELIGRDLANLRAGIVATLSAEPFGWKHLLGKERGGVQTLLEHALAVFDVLATCMQFFAADSRPVPTPDELVTILLAAVVHDAGKASDAWQRYVRGEASEGAKHVLEEEIRLVAATVSGRVGIDLGSRIEDVASCSLLHDRGTRTDAGELAEWARPTISSRVRKLADYVNHADSLASCSDLMGAQRFLADNPLLRGAARETSYSIRLRGVSTTYLHDAARQAFEKAGWQPLLFFENGTLFVGDGREVETADVARELRVLLDELIKRRRDQLPELAVGKPLGDFLPRPEYVRREDLRALWDVAVRRVGRKAKPDPVAEMKWREQWKREAAKGRLDGSPAPTDAQIQALRDVGPEACAFKLAKSLFERVVGEEAGSEARRSYDERFGSGAFDRLSSQSTYMPVQDYALCVFPWHQMRAKDFGQSGAGLIGSLDPDLRTELLVETLIRVTEQALAARPEPLSSESVLGEWTQTIVRDLGLRVGRSDREGVQAQLDGYTDLKAKGRRRGLQCAQCSDVITIGEESVQTAALGNQGSFSNRRLVFANSGSPPVCRACTIDLKLGQLCVGGEVRVGIVVVPRRALTVDGAREVVGRLTELKITVDRQLDADTMDPTFYVAFSFPVDGLRVAGAGRPLTECFVRPVSKETRKKRAKTLHAELIERMGDEGLERFCRDTGSKFESFEKLAESLMAGSAPEAVKRDPDVRHALEKLATTPLDFASVTPNLVFVSLGRDIGTDDDSASDRAILAFAMAALIAREVDGAVAVAPLEEVRTALATRAGRTVYVPANGPARQTLGGDWLRIDEAQTRLRGIQAAIALRSGLEARSLLEVLRYPSRGFTVRRLETKSEREVFWPDVWDDIEALGKVLER